MSGPGDCTSRESVERRTTVVPLPVGIVVMLFGLAVHVARHADLPLFIQLHPLLLKLRGLLFQLHPLLLKQCRLLIQLRTLLIQLLGEFLEF